MEENYEEALRRIEQAIAQKPLYLDLSRLQLKSVPPGIGQLVGLPPLFAAR